jgi:hypothetical protein
LKLLEVVWVDSMVLNDGGWDSREGHESAYEEMEHVSSGYLFSEDQRAIIICSSYYPEGDRAAGALLIPRSAIVTMREVQPLSPPAATEET